MQENAGLSGFSQHGGLAAVACWDCQQKVGGGGLKTDTRFFPPSQKQEEKEALLLFYNRTAEAKIRSVM